MPPAKQNTPAYPSSTKAEEQKQRIIAMYAQRWLTFAAISRAMKEEHGDDISVYMVKKIIKAEDVKRDPASAKAPERPAPRAGVKGKVGNCAYATKEELDKHVDAILSWAKEGVEFKAIVSRLREKHGILTYPQAVSAFLRGWGFKGGRKQQSMEDRMVKARPLFQNGESNQEIARRLGVSLSYVYRMSKAYREENSVSS